MIDGVTVYDDFAHHPTAIETTLKGLRARVGAQRILAVLEPRSNTMKLGVHRDQLAPSLGMADKSWFFAPRDLGWDLKGAVSSMGDRVESGGRASMNSCTRAGRRGTPGRSCSDHEQRRLWRSARQVVGGVAGALMAAPQSIALFPLNVVLFPEGPLPLRIFETRYVDMVRRCMREDQRFGVALIREGSESGPADTFDVGTMAKIVDFHQLSDGFLGLSCVGEQRFRILSRSRQTDGLNLAGIDSLEPETKTASCLKRHARLAELLKTVLPQLGEVYAGIEMHLDDAVWVGYRLAEILPIAACGKTILPGTQ